MSWLLSHSFPVYFCLLCFATCSRPLIFSNLSKSYGLFCQITPPIADVSAKMHMQKMFFVSLRKQAGSEDSSKFTCSGYCASEGAAQALHMAPDRADVGHSWSLTPQIKLLGSQHRPRRPLPLCQNSPKPTEGFTRAGKQENVNTQPSHTNLHFLRELGKGNEDVKKQKAKLALADEIGGRVTCTEKH